MLELGSRGLNGTIEDDTLTVHAVLETNQEVVLGLDLKSASPYSLPEFQVDFNVSPYLKGLPHIGPTGIICSFDPATCSSNPLNQEGVIAEVAEQAVLILNDGVTGRNNSDYFDEFLAYWSLEISNRHPTMYLLSEPSEAAGMLYAQPGQHNGNAYCCVGKSADDAHSYASKIGTADDLNSSFRCLYLRLAEPIGFPLPSTTKEWYDEIARNGQTLLSHYESYASTQVDTPFFAICSVPMQAGRAIICFRQQGVRSQNGFRKGCAPYKLCLHANGYDKETVERMCIYDARQERLFTRGGDGLMSSDNHLIIGCGSLGSHLAGFICDTGATELTLVDNETLAVENIARHLCGLSSVGLKKTDAVKAQLEGANPNVMCRSVFKDANEFFEDIAENLGEYDAVFVTAADAALEYHAVQKKHDGSIRGTLFLLWVEPYALAGHAIVINKPQDIYSSMFDEQLQFTSPVVANALDFYSREAGCQSTYMPYSGLAAQEFMLALLHDWKSVFSANPNKNYLFTWLGKLSKAEEYGARISPSFCKRGRLFQSLQKNRLSYGD